MQVCWLPPNMTVVKQVRTLFPSLYTSSSSNVDNNGTSRMEWPAELVNIIMNYLTPIV